MTFLLPDLSDFVKNKSQAVVLIKQLPIKGLRQN